MLGSVSDLSAQTPPCGTFTSSPAYINVAAWLNQDYIDANGGVQAARQKVETILKAGFEKMSADYQIQGYNITFRLIFIPEAIAPAVQPNAQYVQTIRAQFNAQWPCVAEDLIVVPSKFPGAGFGSEDSRVAIVGMQTADYNTLAHEIGHVMGLQHPPVSQCQGASNLQPFMCPGSNNPFLALASSNRVALNTQILPAKCFAWQDAQEVYPSTHTCPTAPTIAIENDQPFLTNQCTPDRSYVNVTVTVTAGDAGNNVRIRARYSNLAYTLDNFGADFNDLIQNPNDSRILRILENGVEKVFALGPFEQKTVMFRLHYDPKSSNPTSLHALVQGELFSAVGTSPAKTTQTSPKVFKTLQGVQNIDILDNEPLFVTGNLLLQGQPAYSDILIAAPRILVAEGASISSPKNLKFTTSQYLIVEGCTGMWRGFTINSGGSIEMNNAEIRDAQVAITSNSPFVPGGATSPLRLNRVRFFNNNVGLRLDPSFGSANYALSFIRDCSFDFEAFRTPYANQSPMPAEKPFCGIYINNANAANVLQGVNTFCNLKFGIIANNTNLFVNNSAFAHIGGAVPAPTYYTIFPNTPALSAGVALYARGGVIEASHNTVTDAVTGIETRNSTLRAANNTMTQVESGIVASATSGNTTLHIRTNQISASLRGIQASHLNALPGQFRIDGGNQVTMDGNPLGIGIQASGGGNLFGLLNHARIAGNTVTMNQGLTGILLRDAKAAELYTNAVNLTNANAAMQGIKVEGGDKNVISDNYISGITNAEGILSLHSSAAVFHCNTTQSPTTGMRFEGMMIGKKAAEIAGNTFLNNQTGLLLGQGAATGPQIHRGNIWSGSFANIGALNLGDPWISQFVVDATANPLFLPPTSFPFGWFIDETNTGAPFLCPVAVAGEPPFDLTAHDVAVATGAAGSGPDAALNNWIARTRLYERFAEAGNPHGSNPDISAFLSASLSNGVADYALMRANIRAAMQPAPEAAAQLAALDSLIGADLQALAQQNALLPQAANAADSLLVAEAIATLAEQVAEVAATRADLIADALSSRSAAADNLILQNAALPAPTPWQTHEKTVNDIFLQSLGKGLPDLSAAQVASLQDIAALCPLSDGEAVFAARALLDMYGLGAAYDDEALCNSTAPRTSATNRTSLGLVAYPNPTGDLLTVDYTAPQAGLRLRVLNTLGQTLYDQPLAGAEGRQQLRLSALAPGMYWLRLEGQNEIRSSKILIQR